MATDLVDLVAREIGYFLLQEGAATRTTEFAEHILAALEASGGPHGPLGYRSSACIHAAEPGREHLHLDCQTNATRYDGTAKVAAQCKYGAEPCTCPCHQEVPDGD